MLKNEIAETRKHVQKILNDVDEFLKTIDMLKKGFIATISEDLQKLDQYLGSIEKEDTIQE